MVRLKLWHITQRLLILLSVSTLVVAINPAAMYSSALNGCEEFYSNNNITMYNPCVSSTVCGPNTGIVGSSTIKSLRGANNGEKIYNFWVDAGMTPQESAGITASLKQEANFSAFRQENGASWPNGGWGIAQFTGEQRTNAVAYVSNSIDNDIFSQYYAETYGGDVTEANGFVPTGVPPDVNNSFLLGELNYLLQNAQSTVPNSERRQAYQADFGKSVGDLQTIYDHIKTLTQPGDAAVAWTYLYEAPANVKTKATERQAIASSVFELFSTGSGATTGCGGNLTAGGMNLSQAIDFMNDYKSDPNNVKYIGTADRGCPGGALSNCVSFSMYFVNKYTTINGHNRAGNGSIVVANLVKNNSKLNLETGNSPRPYAIFSTPSGSQYCGAVLCGHTGVILGVDIERKKVIVGEASCSEKSSWDTAREYDLSKFDSKNYTYVYTDGLLKGAVE